MILKKEIEDKAAEKNLSRDTIEKDWMLGHFIDAIFSIEECKNKLLFKGGTSLRKCFFENYRFSEDLDFTSTDPSFSLSKKLMNQILEIISIRTEVILHLESLIDLKHKDKLTGYCAYVKFWGANHLKYQIPPPPKRWTTQIKIEIISYEKMIFPFVLKPIIHGYSDHLISKEVPCYDIKEIIAEKIRALIQRSYSAPRDYYDLWYLTKNIPNLNWKQIKEAFYKKIEFKNIPFDNINQLINDENDKKINTAWNNSLAHQIQKKDLPYYIEVKKYLKKLFEEVFNQTIKI